MWQQIATSVGSTALKSVLGSLGGSDALPEVVLGFNHPGVDMDRARRDPRYAEAARRAEAWHRATYGVSFTQPNANGDGSPVAAVQQLIEAKYREVVAEQPVLSQGAPMYDLESATRDALRAIVTQVSSSIGTGPVIPDHGSMGGSGFPVATPAAFPTFPALGAALGSVVRAGAGVVRSVGGKILAVVLPSGMKVSRKAAVNLAKQMGITAAATALGIGAVEMAEMVMAEQGRGARARGVTGAQLRTTRRTMRTVERMHKQIAGYCRDAGVKTTRVVRVAAKRCR